MKVSKEEAIAVYINSRNIFQSVQCTTLWFQETGTRNYYVVIYYRKTWSYEKYSIDKDDSLFQLTRRHSPFVYPTVIKLYGRTCNEARAML